MPLVCRSWRQQLNSSPQLLWRVNVAFAGSRAPARLAGFYKWMLRCGLRHVRCLSLRLEPDLDREEDDPPRHEAAETLSALLSACGAAGALEQLMVRHNVPAYSLSWLAAFSTLRRLHIATDTPEMMNGAADEVFNPPEWALGGLEDLSLAARALAVPPGAHLPRSLVRLHLLGLIPQDLPPQVQLLGCDDAACLLGVGEYVFLPTHKHSMA